ncbi:hypothetical protein [Paenibacillus wenxiniae]
MPLSELLRNFTNAQLEEVDFRLGLDEQIVTMHDTLLTVRLCQAGIDVSFQRDHDDPATALCSVKTKDAPIYRLEALLRYRQQQGIDDQLSLEQQLYTFAAHPHVFQEAKQLFCELLLTGLARLPQTVTARLETLAITARSQGMPNLELLLRGIQGELELFFARHVRFQMAVLRTRLMEAYLSLESWQQEISAAQRARLAGSFRTKYYTVSQLQLYGMGAEPWETRSGYRGITCYLYCPADQRMYTYTDTRPVYYESTNFNYSTQYQQSIPWRHAISLQRFAKGHWSFRAVKINRDRRLSTGEVAGLEEHSRQWVEELDFEPYALGKDGIIHFTTALTMQPSLFGENNRRLHILFIARVESIDFDRLSQTTRMIVETEAAEKIELTLLDHPEWRQQLKRIERSEAIRKLVHFRALVQTDGRQWYPISFLQEDRILNLMLDQL